MTLKCAVHSPGLGLMSIWTGWFGDDVSGTGAAAATVSTEARAKSVENRMLAVVVGEKS